MAKSNAKSSKSNKTAHVLNLLTEPGEAGVPAQASRAPHTETPAPTTHDDNSAEVAAAIRSALEEDLLAELEDDASQPEAEPIPEPVPAPEPPIEAPVPPEPEPVVEVSPQPEPVVEAPAAPQEPEPKVEQAPQQEPAPELSSQPDPVPEPAPQPEAKPEEAPKENGITYVNVMQALVEDKVDKYMERFGMCRCHRCRTDVIALTLTTLPAKYVVIPENEGVPMLSIYEGRYSAAVTAQIMSACQKVAEHPRHSPQGDGSLRLGAPRKDD